MSVKTIDFGGKQIQITGSALTPFIYSDEFGRDMLNDMTDMDKNLTVMAKFIWAMARNVNYPSPFPSFMEWVSQFEHIDMMNDELIELVSDMMLRFLTGNGVPTGAEDMVEEKQKEEQGKQDKN